jgi:hypothetical protein
MTRHAHAGVFVLHLRAPSGAAGIHQLRALLKAFGCHRWRCISAR